MKHNYCDYGNQENEATSQLPVCLPKSSIPEEQLHKMHAHHHNGSDMGHSTPTMLKTVYQHIQDTKEQEVTKAIDNKMDDLFK